MRTTARPGGEARAGRRMDSTSITTESEVDDGREEDGGGLWSLQNLILLLLALPFPSGLSFRSVSLFSDCLFFLSLSFIFGHLGHDQLVSSV
jgi:hypothetical protein